MGRKVFSEMVSYLLPFPHDEYVLSSLVKTAIWQRHCINQYSVKLFIKSAFFFYLQDKSNIPWWLGLSPKGIGLYDHGDKIKPRKVKHILINAYFCTTVYHLHQFQMALPSFKTFKQECNLQAISFRMSYWVWKCVALGEWNFSLLNVLALNIKVCFLLRFNPIFSFSDFYVGSDRKHLLQR